MSVEPLGSQYLTVREAMHEFATKRELDAISASVQQIARKVDTLPSRAEHELHWNMDDTWRAKVGGDLDSLKSGRIPAWLQAVVAPTVAAILTVIAVKGLHL